MRFPTPPSSAPERASGSNSIAAARAFRGDRPAPDVSGRTVLLIDDGLATGSTMEAAVLALRERGPARIVIAVPVGARETCARLASIADELVAVDMPEPFMAVGAWYVDFTQTTDEEVTAALATEDRGRGRPQHPSGGLS